LQANEQWTADSHTVMYGVIGDPIRHSKSPVMLNRAFRETGVNAAYAAFEISPGQLKDAVNGIKALQFRGLNVTIPHKVEVMAYLDHIDESARMIGAVNTIVNDDGKLTGYNTDGIGYVRSLQEETGFSVKGKKILLLGAGGAARGVAYALAKEGAAAIWVANRTPQRATELAKIINSLTAAEGMGLSEISDIKTKVDLVVNTTSSGMHPHINNTPIDDLSWFHPGLVVSDLIYNPRITKLLKEAQARGARIHGGLGMFVYQGAYAFEYWTGQPAPVKAMRQAAEMSLAE
jgi:shikimate dehydrogenase